MPAPAARVGDAIITGHACSATSTIALSLQSKVFIGGLPANRVGDPADMGVIISGAPNVIIGP